MDIYDRLGVARRVNGAGTLTRLGGSLMAPEVLDAMREAAGGFVDIAELQAAASNAIARHTGAEAGLVTSGAAAALTLATAACLTGMAAAAMDRLPATDGMAREATEIQNIQIADGGVCHGWTIPVHMVFPRLFTCPTAFGKTFKVEFEVNLVVLFHDGHLLTENFPLKIVRTKAPEPANE